MQHCVAAKAAQSSPLCKEKVKKRKRERERERERGGHTKPISNISYAHHKMRRNREID
jgi:hypothetical protein